MIAARNNRRNGERMNRNSVIVVAAAAIAVFVAAYVWVPFHAVDALCQAVRNREEATSVGELVDDPTHGEPGHPGADEGNTLAREK